MSATVRDDNFRTDDFTILNIVNFELFGMTEMLKDLSVFMKSLSHILQTAATIAEPCFFSVILPITVHHSE